MWTTLGWGSPQVQSLNVLIFFFKGTVLTLTAERSLLLASTLKNTANETAKRQKKNFIPAIETIIPKEVAGERVENKLPVMMQIFRLLIHRKVDFFSGIWRLTSFEWCNRKGFPLLKRTLHISKLAHKISIAFLHPSVDVTVGENGAGNRNGTFHLSRSGQRIIYKRLWLLILTC